MTIPVFFTFDENYVVPAVVTLHSMLSHADPRHTYPLHVLHMGLSERARRELHRAVAPFPNATLSFIDTSAYDAGIEACPGKSHFSREIFFKLTAADLFPQYDRILCSDVDMLYTGDIAPSFSAFEGEDFYYAGVDTILPSTRMSLYPSFTDEERYWLEREINAGYLLFNLAAIRRDGMQRIMTDYYKANYARLPFPEQDCMALCCRERVRHFPMRYMVCNNFYTVHPDTTAFYPVIASLPADDAARRAAFKAALTDPVEIHYIGAQKPWNSLGVPRQSLWLKALWRSGATAYFLRVLPRILSRKMQRYSLRRFLSKRFSRKAGHPTV